MYCNNCTFCIHRLRIECIGDNIICVSCFACRCITTGYKIHLHRAVTLKMHCTVESFVFYFPFEQYVHGGGLIRRAQNDNRLIYQTAANRLPVLFYLLQVMYMTLQYLPPVGYVPNTSTYDNWHSLTVADILCMYLEIVTVRYCVPIISMYGNIKKKFAANWICVLE